MHAQGIVHRDLKPDNVIFARSHEGDELVKIVDFGISRIVSAGESTQLTRPGAVLGTISYMAPEQARAEPDVDARADVYSVGAILYELLVGRPPHVGTSWQQVLAAVLTEPVVPLRTLRPDLPELLCEVVGHSLARDREQRFGNAGAMRGALGGAARELLDDAWTQAPSFASAHVVPPAAVGAPSTGGAWPGSPSAGVAASTSTAAGDPHGRAVALAHTPPPSPSPAPSAPRLSMPLLVAIGAGLIALVAVVAAGAALLAAFRGGSSTPPPIVTQQSADAGASASANASPGGPDASSPAALAAVLDAGLALDPAQLAALGELGDDPDDVAALLGALGPLGALGGGRESSTAQPALSNGPDDPEVARGVQSRVARATVCDPRARLRARAS